MKQDSAGNDLTKNIDSITNERRDSLCRVFLSLWPLIPAGFSFLLALWLNKGVILIFYICGVVFPGMIVWSVIGLNIVKRNPSRFGTPAYMVNIIGTVFWTVAWLLTAISLLTGNFSFEM